MQFISENLNPCNAVNACEIPSLKQARTLESHYDKVQDLLEIYNSYKCNDIIKVIEKAGSSPFEIAYNTIKNEFNVIFVNMTKGLSIERFEKNINKPLIILCHDNVKFIRITESIMDLKDCISKKDLQATKIQELRVFAVLFEIDIKSSVNEKLKLKQDLIDDVIKKLKNN